MPCSQSGVPCGRFILRFDDTDTRALARGLCRCDRRRSRSGSASCPDQVVRQSERVALYEGAATDRLKAAWIGSIACYETADELDRRRKRQQARGLPPVYDRAALRPDRRRIARGWKPEGRRPHWRFRLETGSSVELDRSASAATEPYRLRLAVRSRSSSARTRSYLYTLPSVADDLDHGRHAM